MVQPVLSPLVERPAHVPEALVYDLDYYADPGVLQDAHGRALQVAKEAPGVFWTPRQGGHWVLRSHNAVFEASRDTERFSNAPISFEQLQAIIESLPEGAPKPLIPAPITFDPPHHAVYRNPLQKAFSPKAMNVLKDNIRALAVELIEKVKPQGGCAFVKDISEPMPVTIFLQMFGLPVDRQREYRDLVEEHFAQTDKDPQLIQARLRKVADVMRDAILERKDNPQNDLISLLWDSEFNGQKATLHDIENYAVMLFTAGLDTVVNGMALGAVHLAKNPQLQAEMRAHPEKTSDLTEEMLRRYTFTLPPRFVAEDCEFQGVQMKKGEMALLFLPGADLDAAEYPNPEVFDANREGKPHIAFGAGPHRCLGSHLARIELNILYEEMMARLPEFRLDPDKPLTYHGGHVWGPNEVYLKWDV
ncbi:cytochrome P450 [Pseudomaricurvus sp. HS19]|uniref:cytochrome P450 n=1 Tax=Pseudomaricurvus sp. HS19 TaxID=2692626 RepID=UPI001367F35D|nr:cytochrome P450 [Pseudomaricurvus sp. HS19]MYM64039.1 cytochrome P450 [Pseudomaricurvus sp. HS19]